MRGRPTRFAVIATCLVLWILAPTGCGRDEPTEIQPADVVLEERTVKRETEGCVGPDRFSCARFLIEYPEIVNSSDETVRLKLEQAIRAMLDVPPEAASLAEGLETMAEAFLADHLAAWTQFPNTASMAEWFIQKRVQVIHHDERWLSFRTELLSFAGGAHPLSPTNLSSFDLITGDRLQMADLFQPESEATLNGIAEREFRKVREIDAGSSLTKAGFWFPEDAFKVNENFAVADEGLLIHFNAYEVGPYSLGPTEILIGRTELAGIAHPDGPFGVQAP